MVPNPRGTIRLLLRALACLAAMIVFRGVPAGPVPAHLDESVITCGEMYSGAIEPLSPEPDGNDRKAKVFWLTLTEDSRVFTHNCSPTS